MDGFERDTKVIVLAATNRPDVLDPALLRPGRFDRRIILDLPDINDREEILKIHSRNKTFTPDVNLRKAAERTPGFSGADLANLMNEAAILAARKTKNKSNSRTFWIPLKKSFWDRNAAAAFCLKKKKILPLIMKPATLSSPPA